MKLFLYQILECRNKDCQGPGKTNYPLMLKVDKTESLDTPRNIGLTLRLFKEDRLDIPVLRQAAQQIPNSPPFPSDADLEPLKSLVLDPSTQPPQVLLNLAYFLFGVHNCDISHF